MIYYISNPFLWNYEYFDTEQYENAFELATVKLEEYKTTLLSQEANRFHFAKVTKIDGGEVWSDGDINNDPEEGDYHVFNQYTGTYDAFSTLSEVKKNIANKQQQYLVESQLDKVREKIEPPKITLAEIYLATGNN